MLKILIADDEPKIRRGIYGILHDSDLDIELLEPAKNGVIAYEIAQREKPDILLLDIHMPKKDGLELITDLQHILPESHVVIISGHDEFEYAQKAIALKVHSYLLKPILPEKLLQVVAQIIEEQKLRHSKDQYLQWAKTEVQRRIHDISSNFFISWTTKELSSTTILSTLKHLNVDLEEDMLLINIHLLSSLKANQPSWNKENLFFSLSNIAGETCLNFDITPIIFQGGHDNVILLISPIYLSLQNQLLRRIEKNIYTYLEQQVFINSKLIPNIIENLPEQYMILIAEQNTVKQFNTIAKKAKQYIDTHYYDEGLSLQQVADEMNVTLSYLSRLLRKELHLSFTEYLMELRISKAVELLENPNTELKIADIAQNVGYTSQHYFSKVFKKKYNMAPSDYMRKVKTQNEI